MPPAVEATTAPPESRLSGGKRGHSATVDTEKRRQAGGAAFSEQLGRRPKRA